MKAIVVALMVVVLFLFAGCQRSEDFSRYPSLEIPQYELSDYYALLFHKNAEVVCNAICILGQEADSLASMLGSEEKAKDPEGYNMALNIFNRIMQLLESKDERIVSRSLRFLQLFNMNYEKRDELIGPLVKIALGAPNVQYEQIVTLSMLVTTNTKIDPAFVKKFLRSRSWLVSHAAYLLVNSLQDDSLRQELIRKYRLTTDEMEKLLILLALRDGFSDQVFNFFTEELTVSKDSRIRTQIFDMLGGAQNIDTVVSWLDTNYRKLSSKDIDYLVAINRSALTDDASGAILIAVIKKGFIPDDAFLKKLNDSLKEYELRENLNEQEKAKYNHLLNLEKAVAAQEYLKPRWFSIRNKTQILTPVLRNMQKDYDAVLDRFAAEVDSILKKYKMDETKRVEYLKNLKQSKKYFLSTFAQ